jgi:hypothetical protein
VVDAVADRVKDVAKDINHMTDNLAKAVVHVFKPEEKKPEDK